MWRIGHWFSGVEGGLERLGREASSFFIRPGIGGTHARPADHALCPRTGIPRIHIEIKDIYWSDAANGILLTEKEKRNVSFS